MPPKHVQVSNISWEDRTLLYLNRLVKHLSITEFHAVLKDNLWTVWWIKEEGIRGKTTSKTFALSLLGSILLLLHESYFPTGSTEGAESALLIYFFEVIQTSLSNRLNQVIPNVNYFHKQYKRKYRRDPDTGREVKIEEEEEKENSSNETD